MTDTVNLNPYGGMTNPARFPNSRISAGAARASLAVLLAGTTDELLAGFTVAGLARRYRVRPAEIDKMLSEARARRRLTVRDD